MAHDRYILRKDNDVTWSIIDVFLGLPVRVGRTVLFDLRLEEAAELIEALNRVDRLKRAYWHQKS